jgi:hypothetical protein
MASTIKELIKFLSEYENQEAEICWQFYTKEDFYIDEEEGELTETDFAEIRDKFEKQEGWVCAQDFLSELINESQANKIKTKGQN